MPLTSENPFGRPEDLRASFDPQTCGCESCKIARFEPSKLRGAVVHQYSYKPNPWSLRAVKNDPFSYYLGVELETDNFALGKNRLGDRILNYANVSNEMAADMRLPRTLWIAKRDASVSGPEFVSMPATLTYWKRQEKKLSEMFKMLLHAGYRSHDNDRCGMHINISRSAFDSPTHLYRFLSLIHVNPAWSLRMSQRTKESADHWASLDAWREYRFDDRRRICRDIMPRKVMRRDWFSGQRYEAIDYAETPSRYIALNAPHMEPRFEFRLPRGTLRLDRFFKNLEWTTAMVEFTRHGRVKDATPEKFMAYAASNVQMYPNLVNFIRERGMWFAPEVAA